MRSFCGEAIMRPAVQLQLEGGPKGVLGRSPQHQPEETLNMGG